MSTATLEWILGLAGTIIVLLLGGNGFWIKRLVKSIDDLNKKIEGILVGAATHEADIRSVKEDLDDHTTRLNSHSATLKEHGETLAALKEKNRAKRA